MPADRIAAAASRLLSARRAGARVTLAADEIPRDFAEAFAVQEAVVAGVGAPTIGWKVLAVPEGPVVFAPLVASGIIADGGIWRVAGDEPAGIEVEIAFRLGADVAPTASAPGILSAVGSAHVVFELCQSRLTDPSAQPHHVRLADCVSNTGIVAGETITDWREKDLKGLSGRLIVDGKVYAEGKSADPARMLALLPAALASRGKRLEAGQIVITGSLVGINWLTGRHALEGVIDGCGRVTCSLEAR